MEKFVSAAVIMILSSAAAFEGANLLHYQVLEDQTQSLQTEGMDNAKAPRSDVEAQVLKLRRFSSVPGVRGWTRELVRNVLNAASFDEAEAEASYREILKIDPASGADWLELGKLQMRRLGLSERAYVALEMSELADPREIGVMSKRTALHLSIWSDLPERKQRRALNELSEVAPFLPKETVQEIKSIVEKKPEASRRAIRQQLVSRQGEKWWMRAIGL